MGLRTGLRQEQDPIISLRGRTPQFHLRFGRPMVGGRKTPFSDATEEAKAANLQP